MPSVVNWIHLVKARIRFAYFVEVGSAASLQLRGFNEEMRSLIGRSRYIFLDKVSGR